jgi:hypothetical protein
MIFIFYQKFILTFNYLIRNKIEILFFKLYFNELNEYRRRQIT